MRIRSTVLWIIIIIFYISACSHTAEPGIKSGELTLTYNKQLYTRLSFARAKEPLVKAFQPSEVLLADGRELKDFKLKDFHTQSVNNNIGSGESLVVTGVLQTENYHIEKQVVATKYDDIPDFISTRVNYRNLGKKELPVEGWVSNRYTIKALDTSNHKEDFWSFQTGTYPSRPDWVLPVGDDFQQQNYLGMNDSDYGGGTPVADVWRPDAGLAVGHIETEPQLISLPVVSKGAGGTSIAVQFDADSVSEKKYNHTMKPGESISSFETFIYAHTGDYYSSLKTYRKILQSKGIRFSKPSATAYEPIWCAWGYGRNFTLDQVLKTLPKVKQLGFKWVVLDDGWQVAEGDWRTNSKFDTMSMKEFVDRIHGYGLKAKLWWAPLAADPGSRTHENHPEMLLVNKEGNYQHISWWNSHYLDPALASTKKYHEDLVRKFMDEWGFDGLKIDGQHLNQVPPDYGHKDLQEYPEKSVEQLPDFFKAIYETAKKINPNAVVEICPCGTSASSFIMPYMNQPVASDPLNSWQIRLKGKTYKALMGSNVAYYGDHVELSDNQKDFASTVGIGGVIGTKFAWPESSAPDSKYLLTDKKEALVKKWMNIYENNMLPKGNYRGELYDIGFDKPETHAIEKDGTMYYAFYAKRFDGNVELRGLKEDKDYHLVNYETGKDIKSVEGPVARLKTEFTDHLLLKAMPASAGN